MIKKLLIVWSLLLCHLLALDKTSYIPVNFSDKSELLKQEVDTVTNRFLNKSVFPMELYYGYYGGLFEHESCITLKRKRCWSSKSELKTYWKNGRMRENGAGLGQVTRAWRSNGVKRLDTLAYLKKRYPVQLKDLNWNNILDRPDLQMRASLLLHMSNYKNLIKIIPNDFERLAFADSAYNGGMKYIYRDRKKCGLMKDCDPDKWFGNVENINSRGTRILYGNRTANDINRYHVNDVLISRMSKYMIFYLKKGL